MYTGIFKVLPQDSMSYSGNFTITDNKLVEAATKIDWQWIRQQFKKTS